MARRSFDSVTRYSLVEAPPKSLRGDHRGEQFADEGTLILAPGHPDLAPISVAPPSSLAPSMLPPPPPSSVRPSMPSWDDRVWSLPVSERTGTTHPDALAKAKMSARDRSASAMLMIAAAAMLAALASVGFMKRADRTSSEPTVAAAADLVPSAVAPPVAAPIAAPVAAPVTIDMDDEKPSTPAPLRPVVTTPTPKPNTAPVEGVAAPAPVKPAAPATKAEAKEKNAAPANAQQKKALEDLLEQLGEEQLKR